jgi:hypothetical protein
MLILTVTILGTGCGLEDPTEEDVKAAFVTAGVIQNEADTTEDTEGEESTKVEIEYSVKVNKIELIDDEDQANVSATLVEDEGPVERTTDYNLTFKYKNDKWQVTNVSAGQDASSVVLVGEISDKEIAEILSENMMGVTMPDDYYINWANVSSITIVDHDIDADTMTDTVSLEVVGKVDYYQYDFAMVAEFIYNYAGAGSAENGWQYNYYYEVQDDYTYDYSSDYKFSLTTDQIARQLKNNNYSFYACGAYYYMSECEIEEVDYGDVEPDGSRYAETPATISFTYEDVEIEFDCSLEFYFDGSGWSLYGVYDQTLVSFTCSATGKWDGFDDDNNTTTFEITKDLNGNGYPKVVVIVESEENGNYSWEAYLDKYKIGEENTSMQIYFTDWLTEPTDENYYGYSNFSGVLSGNSFAPEETWYSWSFTKNAN